MHRSFQHLGDISLKCSYDIHTDRYDVAHIFSALRTAKMTLVIGNDDLGHSVTKLTKILAFLCCLAFPTEFVVKLQNG